jgi:hypothetical protein
MRRARGRLQRCVVARRNSRVSIGRDSLDERALRVCARRHRNITPSRRVLCALAARIGRDARALKEAMMHGLIYLIGLIVVIMAVLSLLGLR